MLLFVAYFCEAINIKEKIDILGTEYKIEFKNSEEDKILSNNSGYCDDSVKEIVIAHPQTDIDAKKDLTVVKNKVIRHEIIHAFLSESGLSHNSDWATNEEIVDYFAIQAPKIYEVFKILNVL